jgi:hypothetical protein
VFSVTDTAATPLDVVERSALHYLERQHIQEWGLRKPVIIENSLEIKPPEISQGNLFDLGQ